MTGHDDLELATARLFASFLRRTHLSQPADLAEVAASEAHDHLGATEVVLLLVNHEYTSLVPIPDGSGLSRPAQSLDGTMAGRSFCTTDIVFADAAPDDQGPRRRIWLPLLDGTDRVGVLDMHLPARDGRVGEDVVRVCERYAHLLAQTVIAKGLFGDVFERVRRTRPMSVGSQLMLSMLPPALCATDGLVIATMTEPTYDNGGDAFDYALDGDVVHLAVLDGMGHGLSASAATSVAVAAYRTARIAGRTLTESYADTGAAVLDQFGGDRHVTAVLAELERPTGLLSWISAGHPPPLLLRGSKVVKTLEAPASFPFGWGFDGGPTVAHEQLQAGDAVLLYTDGLIEARLADRGPIGIDGLSRFLEQEAAAGRPAPETLRRMRRAVLDHQRGVLQDDATALLVEWHRDTEKNLMPEGVLQAKPTHGVAGGTPALRGEG